ncbi:XdhC family protein [Alicyclobacillus cycloheptanicus]|uniref:Xanthine/CO dehydrogenase XdhC/CoxF family maturation factor n=1 Tax=Alicyclobacillus cycloheptanicus TaxID=1457 RepID=A0ABT9XK54_9BACL|nr:XdhC/CoxI family protein [Alicyclobacillus cycloheptanicus]MDQ0190691.1 xanthine/CO dehydrogenase XdhC/CoxF family maturation factor [Alicyclobacillus cycloheptanicus]WDM00294.1 XdhC family protein [Alicyclobacillus cycloheptanicus]
MSRIDEIRQLFSKMESSWHEGERTALLTITWVKGSAYRLPGAKMMMSEQGKMLGTLSGGCLESDLYGWAVQAMEEDQPRLVHYDLSENELWSLGIGCKGTMEVAIFPVHPDDPFWSAVRAAVQREQAVSVALELPTGRRVLFEDERPIAGEVETLPAAVIERLTAGIGSRTRAEVVEIDGHRFYVDTMRPNERLIVCGAGHDAVPVAALAAKAGFRVTVLDPRAEFNGDNRFPGAEHLVVEPEHADPAELTHSWWVIMNHLQLRDEHALRLALSAQPKWIGVLGPLSRTQEMLSNLGAAMEDGPIHAPVGLDIGAETIDEVAISIVAELLAARAQRNAQPLHGREKIHA